MIDRDSYDRLYLLRDDKQDIFVDLPQLLPQHQLDGIRYLYKQFKKLNPGVILNDPSGYGKCLQVVLFLHAIRPTLGKPIIILCNNEHSVQNWKEHFEIWTDCLKDVEIESSNFPKKQSIYINTVKESGAICRRGHEWGVVVIHAGSAGAALLQLTFKAQYKIWVTSVDLKEDLHKLSLIYEWLYPNTKINLDDFKPKPNDYLDSVAKSIMLDAFLEDFLIRRKDFWPVFEKPHAPEPPIIEPPKVSRKNKDPTGTKVKRSKKRRVEDEELANPDNVEQKVPSVNQTSVDDDKNTYDSSRELFNFNNEGRSSDKSSGTSKIFEKRALDVEDFIRDTEPVTSGDDNSKNVDASTKAEESPTLDFDNAIKDIVQNENELENEISDDYSINRTSPVFNDNDSKNNEVNTLYHNIENYEDIPMIEVKTGVPIESLKENLKAMNGNSIPKIGESKTYIDNEVNNAQNNNEIEKLDKLVPISEPLFSEDKKISEPLFSEDNKISEPLFSEDKKISEPLYSEDKRNDIEKKVKDSNNHEFNNEVHASIDVKPESESNIPETQKKPESDDLDSKLYELEQKVIKQFKGSILDSLF